MGWGWVLTYCWQWYDGEGGLGYWSTIAWCGGAERESDRLTVVAKERLTWDWRKLYKTISSENFSSIRSFGYKVLIWYAFKPIAVWWKYKIQPKSANNLGKIRKFFAYLNWAHKVKWEVDMISALHENQSYLRQQTFLFLSECNSGWSHIQQILHSYLIESHN